MTSVVNLDSRNHIAFQGEYILCQLFLSNGQEGDLCVSTHSQPLPNPKMNARHKSLQESYCTCSIHLQ